MPSSIEGYQHTAIPTRAEGTVADSPVSLSAQVRGDGADEQGRRALVDQAISLRPVLGKLVPL